MPILIAAAAFASGGVAMFGLEDPGTAALRLCPRDPDSYSASENLAGLSLSLGSRFEICAADTGPVGADVTARVPLSGYVSVLVAHRDDEDLWLRASRNASFPSGFLVLARSRPPRIIPGPAIPRLPEDLSISFHVEGAMVSARIRDVGAAQAADRPSPETEWQLATTLAGPWAPVVGVGAGADDVTVRSIRVVTEHAPQGPPAHTLEFGTLGSLARRGPGAFVALVAWAAAAWWWSRDRITRLLTPGELVARGPSRRNAFAQLVVVCLLLAATWKVPGMIAVAGGPVLATLAIRGVASVRERGAERLRRLRARIVPATIGATALAFVVGWLPAPRGEGSPPPLEPVASWRTPSLATVWEMPQADPVEADVDLLLDHGEAVWLRWSAEHPERQGAFTLYSFYSELGRSRPGLLVQRTADAVLLVAINTALPVTMARIPLPASAGPELRVHVSQHGERVSASVGGSSLVWKSLPARHRFFSCLPLTHVGGEPRLACRPVHRLWPSLPAALRLFVPRLLLLGLGVPWLLRRLVARRGRVADVVAAGLERWRVVVTRLVGGALVTAAIAFSDTAALLVNVAVITWIVGGAWIAMRAMWVGRFRPRVVALAVLGGVFGTAVSLPLLGPAAGAYAYVWWRLLPTELTWAFHPSLASAGLRGELRFRDRDHAPAWDRSARPRIVTLGGSQTNGIFYERGTSVAKDQIWPRVLERMHPHLEVVNFGFQRKTSTDMARLAIGSFPLVGGRVYVGVLGCNDGVFFQPDVANAPELRPPLSGFRRLLLDGPSAFPPVSGAWRLFAQITAPVFPVNPKDPNRVIQANVLMLDRFLREHGSRLLVVYEPELCQIIDCEGRLVGFNYELAWGDHDAFRSWTDAHGIAGADLTEGFRGWRDAFLFADPVHFTLDGHAVMASLIDDAVKRLLPDEAAAFDEPSADITAAGQ